jgi:methylenetetrahydrofolate--tRNA-(uracil-5-)-methyltransferase
MHRNTFIDAPRVLSKDFSIKGSPNTYMAGQICGTEGYLEAVASGLVCALNLANSLRGSQKPLVLPEESVLGALLAYSFDESVKDYQPMHVNFGLMKPLPTRVKKKKERYQAYSDRAQASLLEWIKENDLQIELA